MTEPVASLTLPVIEPRFSCPSIVAAISSSTVRGNKTLRSRSIRASWNVPFGGYVMLFYLTCQSACRLCPTSACRLRPTSSTSVRTPSWARRRGGGSEQESEQLPHDKRG